MQIYNRIWGRQTVEAGPARVDRTEFRHSRFFLIVAGGLAALILSGCEERPELNDPTSFSYEIPGSVPLFDEAGVPVEDFRTDIIAGISTGYPFQDSDGDARPDFIILALSGGGAFGAYTAGLLNSWEETGDRPDFDIVTGVSTGALAAALVFAGPDYDATLKEVYTDLDRQDLFSIKPLYGLMTSSIASDHPLKERIYDLVSETFLDQVAKEHDKGRRLFVATTDLDRSRLTVWNMGELAKSENSDRRAWFSEILLASASYPLLFPPVYVPLTGDGGAVMHVDGGVTAPILLRDFMLKLPRQLDPDDPPDLKVFVVVNGKTVAQTHKPVKPLRLAIAAETIGTLFNTATQEILSKTKQVTLQNDGIYRLTFIPEDFELQESSMSFDPVDMKNLYQLGVERITNKSAWTDNVPPM